jgi:hypothetical protein
MIEKSMMLVQSSWNDQQTFRTIPLTDNCPYVEFILDPTTKVLVVISKIKKTTLHMLPKIDDNGDGMMTKIKRPNGRNIREERHKVEVFQEFYIEDLVAIKDLLHLFAVNADTFNYDSFLTLPEQNDTVVEPTKKSKK